jgi:trans-2,3-dihydro-3-hydroxyanthranilate isomerase
VQECGAGLLPVDIDGDAATLTGGTPHLGEIVDGAAVARAIGLTASDLAGDPVRWAGTGIDFGFVHVRPDAVARAEVDTALARRLPAGTGVLVFSFVDGIAHARMFAPGAGVVEDPATGSAALGLGVWLAACGRVAADGETSYLVIQGVEMSRPSRLECVVTGEAGVAVEARVTGTVVPVAEGTIRRPA